MLHPYNIFSFYLWLLMWLHADICVTLKLNSECYMEIFNVLPSK